MTEPTRLIHRQETKGTLLDSVQVDRWEVNLSASASRDEKGQSEIQDDWTE